MASTSTIGRGSSDPPVPPKPPTGFKPKKSGPSRINNRLVALSSAAIISVYAIGLVRTQAAENQITALQSQPTAVVATAPATTVPILSPTPNAVGVANVAPTATAAPAATATTAPAAAKYKDGTYVGSGDSRHGGIEATVVIAGGKITSANVTQCGTRYPCSAVDDLVSEVVAQQGPPVDYVSGATDSSQAYQGAITQALAQAT